MLARLVEALGKPLTAAASAPFTDTVSDWAKDSVAQVYNAGIMTGTSATTFDAKANYTIEQSIVTMVRIADYAG
ncbi:S-layer homology domain-containing protein [Candidatus Agathobaculum pullicola]|uniref:S-layer homology domain-containing protein n=1 Tax=Candidatus Agathobaculum pullicola TaxID=2838426 RepID=UPI003F93EBE2